MDNESIDSGITNAVSQADNDNPSATEGQDKSSPSEKMFTQAQLQAIAAKEARKAEEKTESRLRAEYESKLSQIGSQNSQAAKAGIGGIQGYDTNQIEKMIRETAYKMTQEHISKQIEVDWYAAMDTEKANDPEFEKLYDAIGIEQQPGLILALKDLPNKAKIVKDLAKNPSKYANILTLANSHAPQLALTELKKLSESISSNEEAKKQTKVDAPLSQIRNSTNTRVDDKSYSSFTTSDFRKMLWLRG